MLAEKQEPQALEAWSKGVALFPNSLEAPRALEKSISVYHTSATHADTDQATALTQRLREAYPASPAAVRLTLAGSTRSFDEMNYAEYLRYLNPQKDSLPASEKERLTYAGQAAAGKPDLDFMVKYARQCFVTDKVPAATRYYEGALEQFPDTPRPHERLWERGAGTFWRSEIVVAR